MSGAPKKHDESRLAQVLVVPIVSEKATRVGEKHNQVLFKVLRDASKPEIKTADIITSKRVFKTTFLLAREKPFLTSFWNCVMNHRYWRVA